MMHDPAHDAEAERRRDSILLIAAAVLLSINVLRSAWLCDDAFVTFRTIDNWMNGYGLRWNVNERVQAYTHPLWMFLLSALYLPSRSVALSAWLGSFLALGTSLVLLARTFRSSPLALVPALCALSVSSVFVEFSTSGLENPLTHLGLVLLAREASRKSVEKKAAIRLGLVLGLMAVNRMDTVLFGLPLLVLRLWHGRSWAFTRRTLAACALLPGCWTLFSLIYYGSPVPNTAFAKLGAGIPHLELIEQGLYYLLESVLQQPWSIALLLFGCLVFPLLSTAWAALALGGGLYVLYILWIGGDFMLGRFLSGPVFLAAMCVSAALANAPRKHAFPTAAASFAVALALIVWPEFSGNASWRGSQQASAAQRTPGFVSFSARGVANERDVYISGLGIDSLRRDHPIPDWPWFFAGRAERANAKDPSTRKPRIVVYSVIGMFGYGAGPDVHVIDERGLSEPFLARLPARYDPIWRTGHYDRVIPAGYLESAQLGTCELVERSLCPALERLFRVTRGPLWTWQRWQDIFKLWVGRFVGRRQADRIRHPQLRVVGVEELGPRLPPGKPFHTHYGIPKDGAQIELHKLRHETRWTLGVDHNDGYEVQIRRDGLLVESHVVDPDMGGGIIPLTIQISEDVAEEGYDAIRVLGRGGDGAYALAYAVPGA